MKIRFVFLLGILILSVSPTFTQVVLGSLMSGEAAWQPGAEPSKPFVNALEASQVGYVDQDLLSSAGENRVLIVASADMPPYELAKYMMSFQVTPIFNDFYMTVGTTRASGVKLLASEPGVLAILKDRRVGYALSTDFSFMNSSVKRNLFVLPVEKKGMDSWDDALTGKPETTLREVANITGAKRTWTDLGISGANVTIAVVDTGVDYGSLGLGYSDTVARDRLNCPAAFDADAECMVITNTTVKSTYMVGTRKYLTTSDIDPDVYFGFGPLLGMPAVVKFSDLVGLPWFADMEITGIISRSGNYHFGVMFQYWNMVPDYWISQMFPVLVVDSMTAGVYDTVYVDLSFDWTWLGLVSSIYPEVLPYWPGEWPPEFSFADEMPLSPTAQTVAAGDFTGDGINDLSAGSLGYFLDVWKASPDAADRGLVLKPIDLYGNYTIFVNDWFGHGTYCANSAGGRDFGNPNVGSGIAPGTKIMGIVALWIGDIIEAELWAAGFDLISVSNDWSETIPGYGTVWGTWKYTGNHKADIISNSWAISEWASELQGLHWYDLLTILEDALMVPGYLHPDYPGTVVVHAGGNGAPGYGTFTSPGYATLPIGVGASTSFDSTASSLFGIGGGYSDDVVAWSAAGPTPQGNVKPDVVDVGAWALAPGPVWSGLGDGWNASGVFGGTSMATPLTSGAVALLIQGYAKIHGSKPTPETSKIILKSTAKDLGYDVFLQGSGRVDCFAAVSLALETSGVTFASSVTWDNIRSEIQFSWSSASGFFEDPLQASPPTGPIDDDGWFAGTVRPGNSTSAEFTITNPTGSTITAKITPVVHEQIGSIVYSGITKPMNGWLEGFGDQFNVDLSTMPAGTDLIVASLTVPYSYFDLNKDYQWDNRFRIFILDWTDANPNGIVEPKEVFVVNYGYNTGTTIEARVGLPLTKFRGKPVVWVSQLNQTGVPQVPVSYKVYVSYYKKETWDWVTTQANIIVKAHSAESFTAKLTVPSGTTQGIREGQIVCNITAPYARTCIIPVSLAVPMVLSPKVQAQDITSSQKTELYDPYRVNGYLDWGWRYEAGDWKVWLIDIQDPNVVAAYFSCNWTGKMTDIDMFIINPAGVIVGNATSPYLGDGIFEWQTNTGTTSKYVVSPTSNSLGSPVMGVYTVLLHNVLFDGETYPENLTGRVELLKLNPRGPITLPVKPGRSASATLTLETARTLKDIRIVQNPSTQFPVSIAPSTAQELPALGSKIFTATVTVPEDTPKGVYPVTVEISTPELTGPPMYMPVTVIFNIVADDMPPVVNAISPVDGKVIGKATKVEVYAKDEQDAVESVSYSIDDTKLAGLNLDAATGLWTASIDTTELGDGPHTLVVNATDTAGNSCTKSITFAVDNTDPTAKISAPSIARKSTNITVTGKDANFDRMQLYIDGKLFNVWTAPGVLTQSIDTTKLTDGATLVRLVVFDKAGNNATSEATINIDNVVPMAEVRAPLEGATLGGTCPATVYGYDANFDRMQLYIDGSLAKTWTEGITQTYAWDTASIADGRHTIKLNVVDKAGNAAEKALVAYVDNTKPLVSITSPPDGVELSGTSTIRFSTSDINMESVELIINKTVFYVTGNTSFIWDTTTVGDGKHTIKLIATDSAGNLAEASMSVTIINVRLAIEATRNMYIAISTPIGLIMGITVTWAILKHKKKPPHPASAFP